MAYVCEICNYFHIGDVAPPKCPRCDAPTERFKLRTNSEREDENLEDDMER